MTDNGHVDVVVVDDDDDDYLPPEPVRVATSALISTCPVCTQSTKSHSALQLLRCAEQVDHDDDDDDDETVEEYGHHLDHLAATRTVERRAPRSYRDPVEHEGPLPPRVAERLHQRAVERGDVAPPAPPREPTLAEILAPLPAAEPAPAPHPLDRDPWEVIEEISPTVREEPVMGGIVTLPDGQGVDYEALAAAMRNVIERERDEVVKRGGPIEKQNQELKERLADALEEAAKWRRRANANAEARNSLQRQLDDHIKEQRKARAKKAQDRSGDGAKAVREIKEIIKIVQKLPGWEVKRQGNEHYRFTKDGVFVTDAASSGGSQQVNMATVVKLRKAGVNL